MNGELDKALKRLFYKYELIMRMLIVAQIIQFALFVMLEWKLGFFK